MIITYIYKNLKTINDLEDIEINYFYQEQNKNKLKIDVIFKQYILYSSKWRKTK